MQKVQQKAELEALTAIKEIKDSDPAGFKVLPSPPPPQLPLIHSNLQKQYSAYGYTTEKEFEAAFKKLTVAVHGVAPKKVCEWF